MCNNKTVMMLAMALLAACLSANPVWVEKGPMPLALELAASGCIGDAIFVAGGWDGSTLRNVCYKYDLATDIWTAKTSMPYAHYAAGTGHTAVGSKLEVLAGIGYGGQQDLRSSEYDTLTNAWTAKAPMPTPNGGACAWYGTATYQGRVYCAGNHHQWGSTPYWYGTFTCFDPATNAWTIMPSMPTPRGDVCSAVWNDYLFVFGGYGPSGYLATVERYSFLDNTWATGFAPLPRAVGQARAVTLNDRIYIVGGGDGSGVYADVNVYDPNANTWSSAEPLNHARSGHMMEVVNNCIVVMGGVDRSGVLSSVEALSAGPAPSPILPVPYYSQADAPWCLLTSVSMILKYYGVDRKPWFVAKDLRMPRDMLGMMLPMLILEWRGLGSYLWDFFQHPSEDKTWIDRVRFTLPIREPFADFKNYVQAQIVESRRPLILAMNLGPLLGGHAVVITGCSSDSIYVNDPSGAFVQYLYPGSDRRVSAAVPWSVLEDFYLQRLFVTTLADLSPVPVSPSPVSIEVEPGQMYFTKTTDAGEVKLKMDWCGARLPSDYPYLYEPELPSQHQYFPPNRDFRRAATQDCNLHLWARLGNSSNAVTPAKVAVWVRDPLGGTIGQGEAEYALPPRGRLYQAIASTDPVGVIPDVPLDGQAGCYSASVKLLANDTGEVLDSCLFFFAVERTSRGGRQSAENNPLMPSRSFLNASTPNASDGAVCLSFGLAVSGLARLAVYDITGAEVRVLTHGNRAAGFHSAAWDGRSANGARMPSGTYVCRLQTGRNAVSKTITLID